MLEGVEDEGVDGVGGERREVVERAEFDVLAEVG